MNHELSNKLVLSHVLHVFVFVFHIFSRWTMLYFSIPESQDQAQRKMEAQDKAQAKSLKAWDFLKP